ncbi:hypothetical protein [Azospirillum argentinense]
MLSDEQASPHLSVSVDDVDDEEMQSEAFASYLLVVEEDIARRKEDIARRVEALQRAESKRAWLVTKLARCGATSPNLDTVASVANPVSGPDEIVRPVVLTKPYYPTVTPRPRPESEFWTRMLVQVPQYPARGWTPAQLTVVAQSERPSITNKRVRNQLDRWRKRGLVTYVDGYWCRPAVTPLEQLQEDSLMDN